ncbi:hypothetical protein EVAR_81778_1 [Eumeta japonica]|uniref:Uncharacterized protein n=1 Tax=Eumeta variegata TaxID=151549 RepID=A0A4C1UJ34_EUMVA|nr:hypothetical protein EVAR_81778_1 [Eumeta japonica]
MSKNANEASAVTCPCKAKTCPHDVTSQTTSGRFPETPRIRDYTAFSVGSRNIDLCVSPPRVERWPDGRDLRLNPLSGPRNERLYLRKSRTHRSYHSRLGSQDGEVGRRRSEVGPQRIDDTSKRLELPRSPLRGGGAPPVDKRA